MSTPDTLPDATAINLEMEGKRRIHEAAYHHLVGHGMHPDRDLMRLIATNAITERSGTISGFDFPPGFAGKVRLMRPNFLQTAHGSVRRQNGQAPRGRRAAARNRTR